MVRYVYMRPVHNIEKKLVILLRGRAGCSEFSLLQRLSAHCICSIILACLIVTVYQRTPDIAISEVKECLQGQRTRSVFLDLLFVFCEL